MQRLVEAMAKFKNLYWHIQWDDVDRVAAYDSIQEAKQGALEECKKALARTGDAAVTVVVFRGTGFMAEVTCKREYA